MACGLFPIPYVVICGSFTVPCHLFPIPSVVFLPLLKAQQALIMLRIKKCKILYKISLCNVVALRRPKNRSNKPDYVIRSAQDIEEQNAADVVVKNLY